MRLAKFALERIELSLQLRLSALCLLGALLLSPLGLRLLGSRPRRILFSRRLRRELLLLPTFLLRHRT